MTTSWRRLETPRIRLMMWLRRFTFLSDTCLINNNKLNASYRSLECLVAISIYRAPLVERINKLLVQKLLDMLLAMLLVNTISNKDAFKLILYCLHYYNTSRLLQLSSSGKNISIHTHTHNKWCLREMPTHIYTQQATFERNADTYTQQATFERNADTHTQQETFEKRLHTHKTLEEH